MSARYSPAYSEVIQERSVYKTLACDWHLLEFICKGENFFIRVEEGPSKIRDVNFQWAFETRENVIQR